MSTHFSPEQHLKVFCELHKIWGRWKNEKIPTTHLYLHAYFTLTSPYVLLKCALHPVTRSMVVEKHFGSTGSFLARFSPALSCCTDVALTS